MRRKVIHKNLNRLESELDEFLLRLNIKKKDAGTELTRLVDKYSQYQGLLTIAEKRTLELATKGKALFEEITLAKEKLSKMVGQARLSFSMIWSAGAQVASMVQRIGAEAGMEWAEVLGQSLSVLSNIIAIAYASAAIWAGTGPAGVIMAGVQIANASIAMVLQAQTVAQQQSLEAHREMTSGIMIGENPFS